MGSTNNFAETASASRPAVCHGIIYTTVHDTICVCPHKYPSMNTLYDHLVPANSWVYLRRMLNAANTGESKAREDGRAQGSVIPGADPANSKEYEALQQAWQKLEYTADMTILLDPATEHKIELGACAAAGQVSPYEAL